MASQYRVLFGGGILEGLSLDEVKRAAAARLKLSAAQVETIFSGQKIVLKKGLSSEAAARYSAELKKVGMRVKVLEMRPTGPEHAESRPTSSYTGTGSTPDFDPNKTQVYSSDLHEALYEAPVPVAPRHIEPPRQVIQPPVKVHHAPSVSSPPVKPAPAEDSSLREAKARQLAAAEDELRKSKSSLKSSLNSNSRATAQPESEAEEPPLLGIGFQGRVSRVGFLIGSIVVMSAAVLLTLLGASFGKLGLLIALGVGAIPFLYLELRLFALRFHDVNAKGEQLCVLALVPGINALTLLYLVFFPGNNDVNRYGSPGSTAGPVPVLISISIFALILTAAILRFPKELLIT